MFTRKIHLLLLLSSPPGLACKATPAPDLSEPAITSGDTTQPMPTTSPELPTMGTHEPTTTSTSGEDGPSSTAASATTGGSGCGDGVVDADEACDEGILGNGDTRYCTENCTLNVCGDGKLLVGWELCDEGPANSDEYGSICGNQCVPGARCGDGKLQPAYESCDLGPDNGGSQGDEQEILCDASCKAQRLRGFVTAAAFSGDLGGLFGADLECRAAADAAGLSEAQRFHAYLSTGEFDAKERFAKVAAMLPYVLVTGKKFAANFPALIEMGPLGQGISVTETGSSLYGVPVATNTAPGGLSFSPDEHCQGWTSAEAVYWARIGLNAVPLGSPDAAAWKTEQWWTGLAARQCNKALLHLYCLEI